MTARYRYVRAAPALVLAALGALLVVPATAFAHAELTDTAPAAEAHLESPPTEVVLVFDGEVEADGSGFTVTGPGGSPVGSGELDLEVAGRNELRGAIDASEPGTYEVAWTVVARDGHPDEGSFTFTVLDAAPVEAPDTRMPAPRAPLLGVIGSLLVAIAAASLAVGRLARR